MARLSNETLDNAIDVYETTLAVCDNGLLADEDYNPMLDRCTLSFLKELKEYRKMEEQGLLLKLPCKVGSKVYQITRNFISEYRTRNFICYDNGNIFFDWECVEGIYVNVHGFHIDEIGKNIFLTKEEAEKALAEMEK